MKIIFQGSRYRATYTPIKRDFKINRVYVGYSPKSPLYEGSHEPWVVTAKEAVKNPDLEIRTRATALISRVAEITY